MLKVYDIAVKKLIEVFSNKIPVVGLQNDDTTDTAESVMSQTGLNSEQDLSSFPVISVFRGPNLTITDGSATKRPSTYLGYQVNTKKGPAYLVSMRGDLEYTIDVFDTTRASAEKIALQLYFRLRNNPQVEVSFDFEDFNYKAESIADLQMGNEISNQRVNDKSKTQVYKIRSTFTLTNAIIYDLIGKSPISDIKYNIKIKMIEGREIVENPPQVINKLNKQ
jgi:hypothetical protein